MPDHPPKLLNYARATPRYRWKWLFLKGVLMVASIVLGLIGGLLFAPAVLLARYSDGALLHWAAAIVVALSGLFFLYCSVRILGVVDRLPAPEPPRYDDGDDPFPSDGDGYA